MTIAEESQLPPTRASIGGAGGALAFAGVTSLGAGAIHAAAAGAHSEHRQAVIAFVTIAVFQIAWGAVALVRSGRTLALVGALGNAAAVGGWVLAKRSGISFVDGLERSERIQFSDALAAALAAVTVLVALFVAVRPRLGVAGSSLASFALATGGAAVALLTLPGMVAAGGHAHADDHAVGADGHGHDTELVSAHEAGGAGAAADGHHATDGSATANASGTGLPEDHPHDPTPALAPVPYDPTRPIDLGGVPGVTPEQQARAENLVAITLARLPKFSDPAVAEALGWRSIGDGLTGHEHFINWSLLDDGRILDPDFPESLVYEVKNGHRTLVSAMFMLEPGATLDTVPDIGGPLTQWHIHDNLCFANGRVVGLTNADGVCTRGEKSANPVPMIHVWITAHPCGPFAALEGVAAGQVGPGEEHRCDHAHGSGA